MKQNTHKLNPRVENQPSRRPSRSFPSVPGTSYSDNAEFASEGLRFDILEIKYEPGRGYEGRDRWARHG